jgi:hypothetical protein
MPPFVVGATGLAEVNAVSAPGGDVVRGAGRAAMEPILEGVEGATCPESGGREHT